MSSPASQVQTSSVLAPFDNRRVLTKCILLQSVHACTCSALTSAILYRVVSALHEDEVDRWAQNSVNKWFPRMPMIKFCMGISYIHVHAHALAHTLASGARVQTHAHANARRLFGVLGIGDSHVGEPDERALRPIYWPSD